MRHGISGATHPPPPSADTLHREGGRVVIHPHTHPTHVPSQVVYPIRSHFAFARFTNFEIVNAHWFRLPLDLPLPPAIFEIAYQFLFLCVHRYDRLALLQISLRLSVDVLKLLIPIRMLASFQGLLIGLQTVVQRM